MAHKIDFEGFKEVFVYESIWLIKLILKMSTESIWLHNDMYQEKLIILELRILILGMSSDVIFVSQGLIREKG